MGHYVKIKSMHNSNKGRRRIPAQKSRKYFQQNLIQERLKLTDVRNQMDVIDIYRIHPMTHKNII